MKLRPPSTPLITVDPYFSIWMPEDNLNAHATVHWTGKEQTINGDLIIDGKEYRFMGNGRKRPCAEQINSDVSALVTDYRFKCNEILLDLSFYTPLFCHDLYRLSRPVSYLKLSYRTLDNSEHDVKVRIAVSEEICLDHQGEGEIEITVGALSDELNYVRMGKLQQTRLRPIGDDVRINWGYFYLGVPGDAINSVSEYDELVFSVSEFKLNAESASTVLFAYDDIDSLEYFHVPVKAYWKQHSQTIDNAMLHAYSEREEMLTECRKFSDNLFNDSLRVGGEQYAELLSLAYRQVIAAHKLCLDDNDRVIFVSKECFSNGCAATVDVTYPSSPMLLYYNTELLKGTMRPIFRYAESEDWEFDFAPHDVGTYPVLNGQVYGRAGSYEHYVEMQMPVEECGNMLIMATNISLIDGNTNFVDQYDAILNGWVKYLIKYGEDPENQLCTDDFAGHLAHNCNLSLKAIMGIRGWAIIKKMQGKLADFEYYKDIAEKMAKSWVERAYDEKGGFRLAFDKPDTFSMKYNMIWDKLWHTQLFEPYAVYAEYASNLTHFNVYGMPLDNRKNYTKSDWLVWTACLAPTKENFENFIAPLYNAYHVSLSRVPMTDWYDTFTAQKIGFQHRSVQGGLFIKLLEEKLKNCLDR